DVGAAELEIDARLALLHAADDLGAKGALEPLRGRLRIRAAQVNVVPGVDRHLLLSNVSRMSLLKVSWRASEAIDSTSHRDLARDQRRYSGFAARRAFSGAALSENGMYPKSANESNVPMHCNAPRSLGRQHESVCSGCSHLDTERHACLADGYHRA